MSKIVCKFETPRDYLVADIEGQKALIDTGSPITMGSSQFHFNGTVHQTMPSIYGRGIESLSQDVQYPMTHLVGLDFLSERPFLINWQKKELTFLEDQKPDGEVVDLRLGLGVSVDFLANGQKCRGIIDTGAPITFKPMDFPSGSPVGKLQDFFPMGGAFETDVFLGDMQIGQRQYKTRFGVIPGIMGKVVPWIVGSDLWKSGPVAFDLTDQWHPKLHLFSNN